MGEKPVRIESLEPQLVFHPKLVHQDLGALRSSGADVLAQVPPLLPFAENRYHSAMVLWDWDHRLPSQLVLLRVLAFHRAEAQTRAREQLEMRERLIRERDKFPEFDVADYDGLGADEVYCFSVSCAGEVGEGRLESPWRRHIPLELQKQTLACLADSHEFQQVRAACEPRSPELGEPETVAWMAPCESGHGKWLIDAWFLTAFDGVIGVGKSFLVDPQDGLVFQVRDISVRAR